MIITFAFCVGDIDEVGFPFIQVFLNATGSGCISDFFSCITFLVVFPMDWGITGYIPI
jgi:hypothetical protein